MSNDDLTPYEKELLEKLPKERMPGAGLEDDVVKALRARGLLRRDRRPALVLTFPRALAAAAACLLLVAGGFALGRWSGAESAPFEDTTAKPAGELSVAVSLQRASSDYLLALKNFTAMPAASADTDEMRQGREVAIKTLYTAADKVSTIVPRRYLAGQLIEMIAPAAADSTLDDAERRPTDDVIWF
jgi:hypothetical protein